MSRIGYARLDSPCCLPAVSCPPLPSLQRGMTPLHVAAAAGCSDIISMILGTPGVDPDEKGPVRDARLLVRSFFAGATTSLRIRSGATARCTSLRQAAPGHPSQPLLRRLASM